MITYPIYEALFLGSSDCLCPVRVHMAAKDKRDTKRKFLIKQNQRYNTIGTMGHKSGEHGSYVTDDGRAQIKLVHGLRATKLTYEQSHYHY